MSPTKHSKKHLARLEVERRQENAIRIGVVSIVVIVVALMIYGYIASPAGQSLIGRTFRQNDPVAIVGEEEITLRQFQARVRYERQQMIRSYQQILAIGQMFGFDPGQDPNYSGQMAQIGMLLNEDNPFFMGDTVLSDMVKEELVRQEAQRRGIIVSEQEVLDRLQTSHGFYKQGTPTPTITPTQVPPMTLSALQASLVTITPTPTLFLTETPTATPTLDPANPPTETPTPGPTNTPMATLPPPPTATPYTEQGYQTAYQETLDDFTEIGWTEEDLKRYVENGIYREKLYALITSEVPATQEQVWARHILVADESTARDLRLRLQSGEDFAALAAEFSQDTSNKDKGGDLGWFGKGAMVPEFETAAFDSPINVIGEPVQTQFGWHIIQVLGHAFNPLDADTFQQVKDQAFTDFVDNLRTTAGEDGTIQWFNEFWQANIPVEPNFAEEMEKFREGTP